MLQSVKVVTVWGMFALCDLVVGIMKRQCLPWVLGFLMAFVDSSWEVGVHSKGFGHARFADKLLEQKGRIFHKNTIAVSGLVSQAHTAGGNQMTRHPFHQHNCCFLGVKCYRTNILPGWPLVTRKKWYAVMLFSPWSSSPNCCPVIVKNFPVSTLAHNQSITNELLITLAMHPIVSTFVRQ